MSRRYDRYSRYDRGGGGWGGFAPYVPVAQRRADAETQRAKLLDYLRSKDAARYTALIAKLGLRK